MTIDTAFFTLPLVERPRRNRRTESIRGLVQETHLLPQHLVSALFVLEGQKQRQPIHSLPGVERLSIDELLREVEKQYLMGVRAVDLFAFIPREKRDRLGSEAFRPGNLIQEAIRALKKELPDLCVMADIALDPYTDHGHDGLIDDKGHVLNDITVQALADMSLLCAEAGADILAPSDMMDGRVGFMRETLDKHGFQDVGICSYSVKSASPLYGPFRDALDSAPKIGNKKSYQLNPANAREALREAHLDAAEGADMLLVKPAITNLDIIARLRAQTNLPIAAYQVSGEYAMVMAAAERGWLKAPETLHEQLLSTRRAGADFIITYAVPQIAHLL